MSVVVQNASPSKTMTATNFAKLEDREAAIRKLERIAEENLQNTLRLLKHNKWQDIKVYRFSSKLIPLIGHELLQGWDPFDTLKPAFKEIGDYVIENEMRVSFHPDHFTVLSTPRPEVLQTSKEDLNRHLRMFKAMELDERAKMNIHIGGAYGNKEKAMERFLRQFEELEDKVKARITLENDDKTFNAIETLTACEKLGVPMVLDIHHHWVNNDSEDAAELWPRIQASWKQGKWSNPASQTNRSTPNLPPKIHASSPKSEKDPRGHADYVEKEGLLQFLRSIAPMTEQLDVMIEAKKKDEALFHLMDDLQGEEGVTIIGQASFEVR